MPNQSIQATLRAIADSLTQPAPSAAIEVATSRDLVPCDASQFLYSTASAILTLPANAFTLGTSIQLLQASAAQLALAPAEGVTVISKNGHLGLNGFGASAFLTQISTNLWHLTGDLTDVAPAAPSTPEYRFFRLEVTMAWRDYLEAWEIALGNAQGNFVPASVSSPSVDFGGLAEFAADGNPATRWHSGEIDTTTFDLTYASPIIPTQLQWTPSFANANYRAPGFIEVKASTTGAFAGEEVTLAAFPNLWDGGWADAQARTFNW